MPQIDNAALKKKIEAAASRAGLGNNEVAAFINGTTAQAPYFKDFLRRALPDGSTVALPESAAKAFDDWVRALHAKSEASGRKSAKQISDLLVKSKGKAPAPKARAPKQPRVHQPTAAQYRPEAAPKKAAPKKAAPKKAAPKKAAPKPKTTRKASKPRKTAEQAAAEAVTDRTIRAAVADARRKGIKGPLKITFNLVVERI